MTALLAEMDTSSRYFRWGRMFCTPGDVTMNQRFRCWSGLLPPPCLSNGNIEWCMYRAKGRENTVAGDI